MKELMCGKKEFVKKKNSIPIHRLIDIYGIKFIKKRKK